MKMFRVMGTCMLCFLLLGASFAYAQTVVEDHDMASVLADQRADAAIFDDKFLIDGYAVKIAEAPKDILLAMINDDNLAHYRKAAAVRVFREKYAAVVVSKERGIIERVFIRQLQRAVSPYVQIELMHALIVMDRYRYFDTMMPALIQKMDHYDQAAHDLAYNSIVSINREGSQRTREARVVFNALRKMFFLSRKKLADADESDPQLRDKLELLRWSIKVLGTEQLQNLPREVINLM